jgi:hypothetical protein
MTEISKLPLGATADLTDYIPSAQADPTSKTGYRSRRLSLLNNLLPLLARRNVWTDVQDFSAPGALVPTLSPGDNSTNAASTAFVAIAVAAGAHMYDHAAALAAAQVPSTANTIAISGYYAVGDGGTGLFKRAAVQAADDGHLQSGDGTWWEYVPETRGVNCKAFGAKADAVDSTPFNGGTGHYGTVTITGTDNTAAIQSAINFALRKKIRTVFLPSGSYKTTGTLHLGWGDTFYSINFEGDFFAYAQGFPGTQIMFTATDRQCLDIAGGRQTSVKGIYFFFAQNFYWVFNNVWVVRNGDPLAPWSLPSSPSGWVDPALTNALATNAPIAAVTVDGFAGAQPSPHYPAVAYPPWTGLSTQYNKNAFSSGVQIIGCYFSGWPVAFALGVNTVSQGDFTVIHDCIISVGAFGISINNTQSRNVDVHNIIFQFLHTLLDNMSFGVGAGEWAGPISNLSGGECYQIFQFNGNAGPLEISHVYSEGGLRRLGVWFSYAGLKLSNWIVTFDDSQYAAERALLECYVYSGEVVFERCEIGSHYGIQNLVYGNVVRTIIGDGNYFHCGARFNTTADIGYQAKSYGGGIIINGGASYPASQNKVRGASQAFYVTGSGSIQTVWSDTDAATDTNYIFLCREGLQSFRDLNSRKWDVIQTTPSFTPVSNAGVYQKSGGAISALAQTGETLTFTYSVPAFESVYGFNNWGFNVGNIFVDQNTGTLFVVIGKSGSGSSVSVTAVQQNNYLNYPGGVFTTTAKLSDGTPTTVVTSGGSFRFIRTDTKFSQRVYFGDFVAGSPNVTNVHTGDLDGSQVATYLPVGTLLFCPGLFNHNVVQVPIVGQLPVDKDTYIGTVTNGGSGTTPGSLTLTAADLTTPANAIASGRFPISPIGIDVSKPAPTPPITKTSNYSQIVSDNSIIFNGAGSITLTMLAAASVPGQWLTVKTVANQPVVSASSNVVPQVGGAAGTAILSGTAGKYARMQSDGTNWIIMEAN